jgi:hypothetical protein
MKREMYLLHSPYPDGTWRGIEKCCGGGTTEVPVAVLLFDTAVEAEEYNRVVARGFWVVVPVTIDIPRVRGALTKKKAQECK